LLAALRSQQNTFFTAKNKSKAHTEASLKVSYILASHKKPYSDGVIIKEAMLGVAESLFHDFKNKNEIISAIKQVPLSRNTVTRRVDEIANDVSDQMKNDLAKCEFFAWQMDESTDITDTPQLLVFIRMVFSDFSVKEALLTNLKLATYTRGRDIYDAIKNMITEQNIPIQKLVAMTTDGAPAMIGRNVGFIGLCEKDEAFPKFNSYHCVIHQENLIAKKLNLDHVMSVIVRIVNFIRGRALNHRLFKDLLDELDSAHGHLIYFAEVRWLSRGKVLTRFIGLMTEIKIFLHSKDSYEEKLDDKVWLADLAFLTDVTAKLNTLNETLQGRKNLISDMMSAISAFVNKIDLWKRQLEEKNFQHFPSFTLLLDAEYLAEYNPAKHVELFHQLKSEFERRFENIFCMEPLFIFVKNPFIDSDVSQLASLMETHCFVNKADAELEIITLRSDIILKSTDNKSDEVFKLMDPVKYKNVLNCALIVKAMFGSTYQCERAFSQLKVIKTKYRSMLTNEHVKNCLILGCTEDYQPDFKKLSENVDSQVSH